jgi:hypothetical protein
MPQPRPLALLLATALLMGAASPARADDVLDEHFDSPIGPTNGTVPTAKKVVVITFMAGTVVSFATSFVFLFQANGAESDRKDLLASTGGGNDSKDAQCTSPAQCAQLASFKQKRDDATDRWTSAMLVGGAFAGATLATLLLWPNVEREKVHVAPQAGPSGGGLVLQGAF